MLSRADVLALPLGYPAQQSQGGGGGGTSPHGCVSMLFGNIVPTPPGIYPFPTVVMPIALSGAMITPSSNKCVASPRGDTGGRWQSQWPCHSLKYRDRSRVHSDSLALTSVYRCHTV